MISLKVIIRAHAATMAKLKADGLLRRSIPNPPPTNNVARNRSIICDLL
jgi:hypothetical protein